VTRILRFPSSVERDPKVAAWLEEREGELGVIARRWFARMRDCGEDVRELLNDGCPVACVADAPFAYVNVFKAHANVGFFHGSALQDPAKLLEGTGKRMRHVQLRPGYRVNVAALDSLIDAAYQDIKLRL
jgi:hypothetical protein